jgi:hypothetical protein
LREQVAKVRTLQDVAAWLKSQGIQFAANSGVRAAEQLPLAYLPQIQAMKDGEMRVFETGTLQVLRIAASKAAPVTEEQATPRIQQFLFSQRSTEAVVKDMKQLKDKAKIEYVGEFATSAAEAEAKAKAAAEAKANAKAEAKAKAAAEAQAREDQIAKARRDADATSKAEAEAREKDEEAGAREKGRRSQSAGGRVEEGRAIEIGETADAGTRKRVCAASSSERAKILCLRWNKTMNSNRLFRPLLLIVALAWGLCANAQTNQPEYEIGRGDNIRIVVFQNPDLTVETRGHRKRHDQLSAGRHGKSRRPDDSRCRAGNCEGI